MVRKFDVYLCESHGTDKPCVILTPDDLCEALPYILIAPITVFKRNFPCRLGVKLKGQQAQIALDLIHTVPKSDLGGRIGSLPDPMQQMLLDMLNEILIK